MSAPTGLRYVTERGEPIADGPFDPQVTRHAVVGFDASDVLYEVVDLRLHGTELTAVVEPHDDRGTHRPRDRDDPAREPFRLTVESSSGVRISLHRLGGTGPDLLICHATGFHGLTYAPLARYLTGHFTVWALDFRGHGSSEAPADGDFGWAGMAADVRSAIDAIGTGPVVGFGHSLGGAAILLAELTRPGSIAGAFLYEPIVFPREVLLARPENPMSGPARKRRDVFPSRREARKRYASRPPLDELRTDALAAYVEHGFVDTDDGEVRLACLPEHEARTYEADVDFTLERLDGLALPLTVAIGLAEDDPGPAALAPAVVEAVAGARLLEYPDLGHFGPLHAPARIAADIVTSVHPTGR